MEDFAIVVKSFIIDMDNKLLMMKRSPATVHKPETWDLPGGKLDFGENPLDGLRRETREETGLSVDILHPLHVHHFTRDDGQKITIITFLCRPKAGKVRLSEEHTEFKWVHVDSALESIDPEFRSDLELYNTVFRNLGR